MILEHLVELRNIHCFAVTIIKLGLNLVKKDADVYLFSNSKF